MEKTKPKFTVVYYKSKKKITQPFDCLVDAVLHWIRKAPEDALIIIDGIKVSPKTKWMEFRKQVQRFDGEQDVIVQGIRRLHDVP